ncbi:DUF6542 domain-containing protein [Mycobacterium basiliense]|uniref:DUF6542 domain-containing protein n=1 Tax=Mycobacterium basiliense TaxID=2094119 RepID=UPI0018D5078A|nr:DUF6542 domain-containing protein [Mycobacterium basiliense]
MSAERASAAVEPSHRSIIPRIPGLPWWGAVLLATTVTAVGYLFDAGHKDLTHVFAGFYIAGCVAAVLAVRQAGVFTAVIQPPLILFVTVPGAYWLFHGGKIGKFKDLLINCGYPLIERFPLMLGTAGAVLLIGLIRWYFGMAQRTSGLVKADTDTDPPPARPSFVSGIAAKLSALLNHDSDGDSDDAAGTGAEPAHGIERRPKSGRTTRSSGSTSRRTDRTRTRRGRPPLDDELDPNAERPRRRRQVPPRDYDPAEPPRRPRRRPRPPGDSDVRAQPPRETRRDPHTRRNPYDRPVPRTSRFDPYGGYEPNQPAEPISRYDRREARYEPYEPYEPYGPYEPPRRRTTPGGANSANPTHHPISQVRYRGSAPRDEMHGGYRDDDRSDRRDRPRPPRRPQPGSREYDD